MTLPRIRETTDGAGSGAAGPQTRSATGPRREAQSTGVVRGPLHGSRGPRGRPISSRSRRMGQVFATSAAARRSRTDDLYASVRGHSCTGPEVPGGGRSAPVVRADRCSLRASGARRRPGGPPGRRTRAQIAPRLLPCAARDQRGRRRGGGSSGWAEAAALVQTGVYAPDAGLRYRSGGPRRWPRHLLRPHEQCRSSRAAPTPRRIGSSSRPGARCALSVKAPTQVSKPCGAAAASLTWPRRRCARTQRRPSAPSLGGAVFATRPCVSGAAEQ